MILSSATPILFPSRPPPAPSSTPLPYTTLFRSPAGAHRRDDDRAGVGRESLRPRLARRRARGDRAGAGGRSRRDADRVLFRSRVASGVRVAYSGRALAVVVRQRQGLGALPRRRG